MKSLPKRSLRYAAVHQWVHRHFGKASKCEKCGATERVHWSNKFHTYQRERNDWQQLCPKCHHDYDKNVPGRQREPHGPFNDVDLTANQHAVVTYLKQHATASNTDIAKKTKIPLGSIPAILKALQKKKRIVRYVPMWIVQK